jgi:hypothetical protein
LGDAVPKLSLNNSDLAAIFPEFYWPRVPRKRKKEIKKIIVRAALEAAKALEDSNV